MGDDVPAVDPGWGIMLSTGKAAGVPSGDICYFFCKNVQIDGISMDKIKYLTSNIEYIITLKKNWYEVKINEARIVDNTVATLNLYTAYINKVWFEAKTQLYFWIKEGGTSTYVDFHIAGTTYDYLPCLIQDKVTISISRGEKTMNLIVKKYGS